MTSLFNTQFKVSYRLFSLVSPAFHYLEAGVCYTCTRQRQHRQIASWTQRTLKSLKFISHNFALLDKKYGEQNNDQDKEERQDNDRIYSHHWIGPPDPVSNLRKCDFVKQKNPNKFDLRLEQEREETYKWNNQFWTHHNSMFFEEKKKFSKKLEAKGISEKEASDEMSKFYKDFLDRNYDLHMEYNREWYRRNFGMLLTSFLASITRIFHR